MVGWRRRAGRDGRDGGRRAAEAMTSIVQVSYRLATIPDGAAGARQLGVYRLGSFAAMTPARRWPACSSRGSARASRCVMAA